MKKIVTIALACFTAASLAAGPLDSAREKLKEGERTFFAENDREGALALYAEAETETARAADSPERAILLAEIWIARGELSEIEECKDEADKSFSKAHEIADALYRERPSDSDACRVSADALMRLLPYRFLTFKARHGFEPRDRAEAALKIDPNNREARLSLGLYYYFCPTIFGGSMDEARRYFDEYAVVAPDDLARFKAAMWLAMANRELGRADEAERAFGLANAIYPNSDWLQAERTKLANKKEARK